MALKIKVYVDSSVFLGWLYGKAATVMKTQKFLNDISIGKYEGIISTVVLNEMIKVIRKKLVERGINNPQNWNQEELKAISLIYKLKGLSILKGEPNEVNTNPNDMTFGKISSQSLSIMKRHKGIVSSHYKTGKKVHDGISTVDSFHIVLAKRFECDFLATLDKDFNQTTSEIQPLMVN